MKGGTERERTGLEEPEDDSGSINHFVNERLSPLQHLETDVQLSVRGCVFVCAHALDICVIRYHFVSRDERVSKSFVLLENNFIRVSLV